MGYDGRTGWDVWIGLVNGCINGWIVFNRMGEWDGVDGCDGMDEWVGIDG